MGEERKSLGLNLLCYGVPALVLLLWAFFLRIEANYEGYSPNDCQQHRIYVDATFAALNRGKLPLELWGDHCCLGAPIFRSYQYLPHLLAAVLMKLTGRSSAWAVHFLTVVFWLLQFPAVFLACRILRLSLPLAALSTLLVPLISGPGLGALSLENYLMSGIGMFAQICAVPTLYLCAALALSLNGAVTQPLNPSRQWQSLSLACLLTLTFLFHHYVGFVGILFYLFSGMIALSLRWLSPRTFLKQSLGIGACVFILTSHQLYSIWQDSSLNFRNTWERPDLWLGHPLRDVIAVVLQGQFLDSQRTQLLSVLTFIGMISLFKRGTPRTIKVFGFFFVLGIYLLLGSRGMGHWAWAHLFPYIQSDRMIMFSHLSAVFLSGYGLYLVFLETRRRLAGRRYARWTLYSCYILAIAWVHNERLQRISSSAQQILRQASLRETLDPELFNKMGNREQRDRFWVDRYALSARWGAIPALTIFAEEGFPHVAISEHSMSYATEMPNLFDPRRRNDYEVFDIHRVVAGNDMPAPDFIELLYENPLLRIFKSPTRGLLDVIRIPSVSTAATPLEFRDSVHAWLRRAEPRKYASILPSSLLGRWPSMAPEPSPQGEPLGQVSQVTLFKDGNIAADFTSLEEGQYGVFRMSFHPNWQVLVDGKNQPNLFVGPGYLGFPLPKGTSHVEISFPEDPIRMQLFYLGGILFLGLLVYLSVSLWAARAKERFPHRVLSPPVEI